MSREWVEKMIRKITGQSLHQNAWHEFSEKYLGDWVLVTLTDGRQFYGRLGIVSGDGSRDVVLWHPFPSDSEDEVYEITETGSALCPADRIAAIMVSESLGSAGKGLLGRDEISTGELV